MANGPVGGGAPLPVLREGAGTLSPRLSPPRGGSRRSGTLLRVPEQRNAGPVRNWKWQGKGEDPPPPAAGWSGGRFEQSSGYGPPVPTSKSSPSWSHWSPQPRIPSAGLQTPPCSPSSPPNGVRPVDGKPLRPTRPPPPPSQDGPTERVVLFVLFVGGCGPVDLPDVDRTVLAGSGRSDRSRQPGGDVHGVAV